MSPACQMLAEVHAQRYFVRRSSELLFHTHIELLSYPPSSYPLSWVCSFLFLQSSMPVTQCPVHGCGAWSNRWGTKSHPLPSPDSFTLQLDGQVATTVNNRICQRCWERHTDHTMGLAGRTRVTPTVSSSPLDALLSAAIIPFLLSPAPLSSPPSVTSLPSPPPTPAPPHHSHPRSSRRFSRIQHCAYFSPSHALLSSCPGLVSCSRHLLRVSARTSSPASWRASTTSVTVCRK